MLLTCLAVGLISCRDTVDPRESNPASHVQKQEATGPVTVLELTCRLSFSNGEQGDVHCGDPGAGASGVSRSVILPWYSEYAVWLPFNLVKDTSTQTWTFIASVKNLLAQPIGTLNGTTAVGSKVVVTYGPVATQGTGDVWITNADGTGNFTAPNQPYFNYPWIVQPQQISPYREMKTHVPNTVTEVTIGIAISTDFPATQNVAATPPDSVPDWLSADSSTIGPTDSIGFFFTKNAAIVVFEDDATLAERQLAVALVGGRVVGGRPSQSGSADYYLWLPDDGSGSQLWTATRRLKALPQVLIAMPMVHLSEMYLKPNDAGDWQASKWQLDPANADINDERWALEEVEAPMAWGCSVGSTGSVIGILDHGFHRSGIDDLKALPVSSYAVNPADTGQHGTYVASVIAAEGNNNTKLTGMMWHAAFDIEDPRLNVSDASGQLHKLTPDRFADRLLVLVNRGVPVINISLGMKYLKKDGKTPRQPGTSAFPDDSAFVEEYARFLANKLSTKATQPLPLIVVGAGNFDYAGANVAVNSWWSVLPILRDSFPDNVIVVGASTKHRSVAKFSGSNVDEPNRASHDLVEMMAPGDSVYVLNRHNNVVRMSGTSLSAPMVTGMTGLLLTFDPSLASSPSELKRLILAGADSSWDAAGENDPARHVVGNGGPYRLLNAFEPLKLAAHRSGGPLCGNRLWYDGYNVVVERVRGDTTSEEAIAAVGAETTFVTHIWPHHGGHRVDLYTSLGAFDQTISFDGSSWQLGPRDTSVGSPIAGPGFSHDLDSLTWLREGNLCSSGNPTIKVMLDKTSIGWPPGSHGTQKAILAGRPPNGVTNDFDAIAFPQSGEWAIALVRACGNLSVGIWAVSLNTGQTRSLGTFEASGHLFVSASEDGAEFVLRYSPATDHSPSTDDCIVEYRSSATGALLRPAIVRGQPDGWGCSPAGQISPLRVFTG